MATSSVPNGTTIHLLWTNSDASSSFAAQSIDINVTRYTTLLVTFKAGTNNTNRTSVVFPVGETTYNATCFTGLGSSSNPLTFAMRTVSSPSTGGVSFGDCSTKTTNATSAGTTANSNLIPLAIYGMR